MRAMEFLFVIALCLYTLVIWFHRFYRKLDKWMIWVFGISLTFDISGTIFLCIMMSGGWEWNLHTISGVLSLFIMAIHFIWALLAITMSKKYEAYFNRYSVPAWCLWLIAFVSGIPL